MLFGFVLHHLKARDRNAAGVSENKFSILKEKKRTKKFALLREPYLTKDGIPVRKGDADSHIFPKE
jgi:hypothetical protein